MIHKKVCVIVLDWLVDFAFELLLTNAFYSCSSIKEVIFENPSSLKTIGFGVFESCYSLSNISIPSSVTFIGFFAFSGCKSLKPFKISKNIGQKIFDKRPSIPKNSRFPPSRIYI